MKQYLSLCVMFFSSLLLSGCANQSKPPSITEPQVVQTPAPSQSCSIALAPFDQVVVTNVADIVINGQQPQTQLLVHGDALSVQTVRTTVKDGVLYISKYEKPFAHQSNTEPTVELNLATPIHALTYQGSGQIVTNNVGDSSLKVDVAGNATMSMKGNLVISQIQAEDNATLHAYWLNTSSLEILTDDNAKVFVAGIASKLNVIASGDSDIDGKYLRADDAFIKTTDTADVAVTIKHTLSSWATQQSTIYYYRDPNFGMHYLAGSGSSLRMTGLPQN